LKASGRRRVFVKARRCDALISLSSKETTMTQHWNVDTARAQYAIPHWGEGYFDVDGRGRLSVHPRGADGPALALPDIVEAARARGSRLPLLVRFADILHHRLARLQGAFAQAMADWDYAGGYTAVYPVKVNQQKGVAGELAAVGGAGFGLEAGSKPELMAVLALAHPGSIVICNGYKDREYLRLALIGRKLGLRVFIVIEKPSELAPALEEAKALGVEPLFGVRVRLTSLGAGKWQNTGGEKSKFGLTPRQLLTLVDELKAANLTQSLRLLHVFMGSQISNVRDIAAGMREATRCCTCSWVRRFPTCAISLRACARRRVTLWNCANSACRSATSTLAADSASITRARARVRPVRSTTDLTSTPRRSSSR
jgi:arginine decarboxylase